MKVVVFGVGPDAVGLSVGWIAVAFVVAVVAAVAAVVVVVVAEFVVVRAKLQAEARVETGVVEKVVASVEFDSAEEMTVAGVVVYVESGAAGVVAAVGSWENCIAAAVEGLAQAAVTAGIGAAAKDVESEADVVVYSERHISAAVAGVDSIAAMAEVQLVETDATRIGADVAE